MARNSLFEVENSEQRAERPAGHLASVTSTYNATEHPTTTDVVIPSNLFPSNYGGLSSIGPQEGGDISARNDPFAFNVQRIAAQQKEELKRAISRSTSVSVGAISRSRSIGHDTSANHFTVAGKRRPLRKTSLTARAEVGGSHLVGWKSQSPSQSSVNNSNNYFGNYAFGKLSRALSDGQTDPLSVVINKDGPAPETGISEWPARQPTTLALIDSRTSQRSKNSVRTRKGSVLHRPVSVVAETFQQIKDTVRRSSLADLYDKAKVRGESLQRKKWAMLLFEYTFYLILVAFVYFVLIGVPLWKGTVYWLYWVFQHKFAVPGTWAVTFGLAMFFAYAPLLLLFEKDPPMPTDPIPNPNMTPGVHNTALMIPCYKSAKIIGPTLVAALKIFPPSHIFVIANGNSPTPLDDTEEVCRPFGVNHVWSPVGSKIVAQFVGCYAAKGFKNVLLIDDDCALPPNFPIVSERMTKDVKCIGYTIKSVGPNSGRGTLCQQAQDLEYKISGLQRALAGKIGSATFPHGAISLWDNNFLLRTFHSHPGFSVSEDWFFGHVARKLGSRIQMCTSVFIETETPNAVFLSSGGDRGGFGEMTIFKQRFMRWNFFFVNGMYYNLAYILGSWNLGVWEIGAKLFVFQELYETLLYLLAPFVLPISFIVRPSFAGYLLVAGFALYALNVIIFNEIHLRIKRERVPSKCVYLYYMPYKMVLTLINVGSCYWSLYKYATYFAKRHPKIIEDERAVNVVMRMEESSNSTEKEGRRMTVTAIGAQLHGSVSDNAGPQGSERKMTITALGPPLDPELSPIIEHSETSGPKITVGGRKFSIASSCASGQHDRKTSVAQGLGIDRSDDPYGLRRVGSTNHDRAPSRTSKYSSIEVERTRSQSSSRVGRRSSSLRRPGSLSRQRTDQQTADFVSPGYEDLLDRLALIEQRLNRQNVETVNLDIEPIERPAPVYLGLRENSYGDLQLSSSDFHLELDDLEVKEDFLRKTDESKSMV